ncbi:MerR family transcriptional regulator [Janibacter melonis]|uniref:MerR family transcriptional regulator n=1 Tax=Janibacter melonis TaxID=262209 RepID=UPI0009FD5B27|nr:MerR family transcriptional regulator [Janibacter melonis]
MTQGIRIGELARRTGLSPDVLRVWERRFELFTPDRTPGGYRLYTPTDERLARDVIALKEQGIGLAAAVKQARSAFEPGAPVPTNEELAKDIGDAVCALDQVAVVAAVRRATHLLGVEAAIVDVFLPYLVVLGHQWETGQVSVAHEHFASHTIRKHVGALGLDLASAGRRVGIVACPPGERHDIAALMTAVVLSRRGWSVRFLGADTPLAAIDTVATRVRADAVVLGGTRREVFEPLTPLVRRLSGSTQVAIGGSGASEELAASIGAALLPSDPVQAVLHLDALVVEPLRSA